MAERTPAQLANDNRLRSQAWERRTGEKATVVAPSRDPSRIVKDETAALSEFATLAAELGTAANDSAAADAVVGKILSLLDGLDTDTKRAVMKRPAMQKLMEGALAVEPPIPAGAAPGSYTYQMVNGQQVPFMKKPWQWNDLKGSPQKTFVPSYSDTIIWNGLRVSVRANEEITLPCEFYGVYMDKIKFTREAEAHAAYLMGQRDTVLGSVLGPPDAPTSSARVRATATINPNTGRPAAIYVPGGGFTPVDVHPDGPAA